jgi:hypothetical protein
VLVSQRIFRKIFFSPKNAKRGHIAVVSPELTEQRMYDNFHGLKHPIFRGVKLASTSYDMFKLHMQTGKYEIEIGIDR